MKENKQSQCEHLRANNLDKYCRDCGYSFYNHRNNGFQACQEMIEYLEARSNKIGFDGTEYGGFKRCIEEAKEYLKTL